MEREGDGRGLYSSPGLSYDRVDNYDVSVKLENVVYTRVYPDGGEATIDPVTHAGPTGAPYYVTGVDGITLTSNDGTKWTLSP